MNSSKIVFVMALAASSLASADHCYNLSRNIESEVRRGTSAVAGLSNDLRGVARVESSITNIAGTLDGASMDLDRELSGSVSDPESSVRSAQGANQGALSELRRAASGEDSLGSEAFRIAGRAATTLENAKQTMTNAANRVGDIKTRISQLHQQLGSSNKAQDAQQQITANIYAVRQLANKFDSLDSLRRLDNQVSSYVNSCSIEGYSCRRIRSEMSVASGRTRDIALDLSNSASGVRRFERLASGAASNVKSMPTIDINGQLNSYIDAQVLPSLQDAVNNLGNASNAAREASQSDSGVRFDQLLKGTAIPSSENAERLAQSGLSGLSGLRGRISDLARQISAQGNNQAAAQDLRQAAREIASLTRQAEASVQKLGGQWGNGGYLEDVRQGLHEHQRAGCEAHE